MAEVAFDVVERVEDSGQAVNATALRKLLAVKRVNRYFQLIKLHARLGIFLERESVGRHRGIEALPRGILDVVGHVRIHQRLSTRKAPSENTELGRLVHPRKDAIPHGTIFGLLVLPDGAVATLHIAVQRRLKHHHERTIKTMPHLTQRVCEH